MSENRYGEKREESETGMKLQNCETQESENKVQESTNEQIKDMGQVVLNSNSRKHKVELLTIIGEVEGHESAPSHSKTTKYEHVLPKLAIIEDDEEIEGLLILLNTVGGDVEAGLAIGTYRMDHHRSTWYCERIVRRYGHRNSDRMSAAQNQ